MSGSILVTGATGQQGGAVARALIAAGTPVRGLVRDPDTDRARALAELGVQLVRGDLDEPGSLARALDGAAGLFSVATPDATSHVEDLEIHRTRALADVARAAGVAQVVHASASGTARRIDEYRWGSSAGHAFEMKARAEDAVREIGARSTTILRPSAFMENFLPPSYFYAPGSTERILVAYDPDVPQAFVAVSDIGAAAAAAFADPQRFDGVELELASERISVRDAVDTLSRVWNRPLTLPTSRDAAIADGLAEVFVRTQSYFSLSPAPAFPEYARAFGIPTMTLEQWAHTV